MLTMRRNVSRSGASFMPVPLTGDPPLLEALEEEFEDDIVKIKLEWSEVCFEKFAFGNYEDTEQEKWKRTARDAPRKGEISKEKEPKRVPKLRYVAEPGT